MEYVPVEGTCCYDCAACTLVQGDTMPCAMRRTLLMIKAMKEEIMDIKDKVNATSPLTAEIGVEGSELDILAIPTEMTTI